MGPAAGQGSHPDGDTSAEAEALRESQAELHRAQELLAAKAQEHAALQARAREARTGRTKAAEDSDSTDTEDTQTPGRTLSQVGTAVEARRRQQHVTWSVEAPPGGRRQASRSRSPDNKVAKEARVGDQASANGGTGAAMHVDAAQVAGGA